MEQQNQMQQMQQLQQQMQEIQEYLSGLEESKKEVSKTRGAVKELEDFEEGSEILAPIGSGAFVRAQIKDTTKVISNIGGDTFEERDNDSAAQILEKQEGLIEETKDELESRMQEMQQQMQQLQQQAQNQQ